MAGSGNAHLRDDPRVLLRVEDLVVEFPVRGNQVVHAVSGVSFDVLAGETVGLVGESGCGKSTTGRAIMHLPPPTSGSVELQGVDLTALSAEELRQTRRQLQMILQDPISSLNPRRRIREIVAQGLDVWGEEDVDDRVDEVLAAVGLDPAVVGDRRPHQFSGGQCQRISIARALVLDPKLLICDEPVSALDVSVQAQLLNLLEDMKERYGLTLVFIAHDLAVVKSISDRVVVMYLGKVCEVAATDDLFAFPRHPYTSTLLASIPQPGHGRTPPVDRDPGEVASPINPPSGCRFRSRCPRAQALCAEQEPVIRELGQGHFLACHFPNETPAALQAEGETSSPPLPSMLPATSR